MAAYLPPPPVRAAIVCEQALEFQEVDGLVYVLDPTDQQPPRVYRRHTFMRTFHNAGRLLRDLHSREDATVIVFPRASHG
jgi:hypothetical protein